MRKKFGRMMDAWGHYFLALLCAGVILLSALWTRQAQDADIPDARALSDQSQRLQDATEGPYGLFWPAKGEILDGMHREAVFYPQFSLWHNHMGIDFAAVPGAEIFSMASGKVTKTEGMIEIVLDNGDICQYFGAAECLVSPGQAVQTGDRIGLAGAAVHFEKENDRICVVLIRGGEKIDFSDELLDKRIK